MRKVTKVNKITVLDACVDGNEPRFDRLIGMDFESFNRVYDIIKDNESLLDCLALNCTDQDDTMMTVRIPTKETSMANIVLPQTTVTITATVDAGYLVINTPIKKEW